MFTEVLVPYNGADDTTRALEIGAGLAQSANAQLRILAYRRVGEHDTVSEDLVQHAFDIGRKYDLNPHVTELEPKRFLSDAIISEASVRPGSLVCMASHGRGRAQLITGSHATEVILYGPGAVVLVGPECEVEFFEHGGPMIAALDGSDEGEELLPIVEDMAFGFGVGLEVVTVVESEPTPALAGAIASGDITESGYVAGLVEHDHDLDDEDVSYEVLHGKPAQAILDEAATVDASMIAVATHAPLGLERLRRGSVTDRIVRKAKVPVLVYCANPFWTAHHLHES